MAKHTPREKKTILEQGTARAERNRAGLAAQFAERRALYNIALAERAEQERLLQEK